MNIEKTIANLEEKNLEASRWIKGNYDRIYINHAWGAYKEMINLVIVYRRSGSTMESTLNGEDISHAEAKRIEARFPNKIWIDVKDGSIHSDLEMPEELKAVIEEAIA